MNLENLAYNIPILCAYYGTSMAKLSTTLHLSDNRINSIVARKQLRVTNEEIELIAKHFKITVDQLLHKKVYLEFK